MIEAPERHMLVADGFVHPAGELNLADRMYVRGFVRQLARGIEIVEIASHLHEIPSDVQRGPGISVVMVITTSHIALHTWPDLSYFMLDITSCRPFEALDALGYVREALDVREWRTLMSWPRPLDLMDL